MKYLTLVERVIALLTFCPHWTRIFFFIGFICFLALGCALVIVFAVGLPSALKKEKQISAREIPGRIERVLSLVPSYPRWAQVFLVIASGCLLTLACSLAIVFFANLPSALEKERTISAGYDSKLSFPPSTDVKPQVTPEGNVPIVGVSHYAYVPLKGNKELRRAASIAAIDMVLLTIYVKNYGRVPADNYVFAYSLTYGSDVIYSTAQDSISLSKGTLLMPGQLSFNQIVFDKEALSKLASTTPMILKIRLMCTDRTGKYKDEVRYTMWVNRNNNPFILKLTSLPHD